MVNANQIEEFMQEDLAKSGLTRDNFKVEPLRDEQELRDRLGFVSINGTCIMDIGGYWIQFPNEPDYCRMKLMREIKDEKGDRIKYLSPSKAKRKGNHVYIPRGVEKLLSAYTPGLEIGLVEGEKKAQAATDAGVPTIGVSGIWNLNDEDNDFLPELEQCNWNDKIIKIAFDSDMTSKPQVKHAELRAAVKFTNRGARVLSVRLPNEPDGSKNGADDYIVRYGRVKYQELNQQARLTFESLISENMKADTFIREIVRLGSVIEKERLVKLLSKHLDVPASAVRAEMEKHAPKADEAATSDSRSETFTEEEKEAAEQLLRSPDILDRMENLTERAGYIGEKMNKRTLYLSYTSRKSERGISLEIKGGSSSGKSTLTHIMQRLMPKQDVYQYSMITAKALVHCEFDLSHKILSVEERHGSEAADYSIRTIISEQEISILISVKDERSGNYKAITKRIPAVGMVYTETTTSERVHNENQTRVFDCFTDESQEMNRMVIEEMGNAAENPRDTEALEGEFRIWRCAQELLKPYKVKIPFAKRLAKEFPTGKTRVRRDFLRFLALIEAHALLYQYRREVDENGYLIATLDDLTGILPLAEKVLMQSLKELSPNKEFVLAIIRSSFEPGHLFSVGDLVESINLYQSIQTGFIDSKSNKNEKLREKIAQSINLYPIFKETHTKPEIKYQTLHNYLKGFVKDGFLEWNDARGVASRYSLSSIISDYRLIDSAIFTPKFLESLQTESINHENIDSYRFIDSDSSNGSNLPQEDRKSAEPEDIESIFNDDGVNRSSIKTVAIDGQLVRLEYDKEAGTITIQRNGKPHIAFDHEPEFQEYLRYFEKEI